MKPWTIISSLLALFSISMHILLLRDLSKNYITKRVQKLNITSECLIFIWLVYGYIRYFANDCDQSANPRNIVFSNILLMLDVRCLRSITIAIFVCLCGPFYALDQFYRWLRRPRPQNLIKNLNSLPIKKVVPNEDADSCCSICLDQFSRKESVVLLPCDNHFFHKECIKGWLKVNNKCPECRQLITIGQLKNQKKIFSEKQKTNTSFLKRNLSSFISTRSDDTDLESSS